MFCPECGKELPGGAWRCELCGADLRRILKEEYWSRHLQRDSESSSASGERFRIPDSSISTDMGRRMIHRDRRPAILWTAVAGVSLFVLILLLYFAFRPVEPTSVPEDEQVAETVAAHRPETTPSKPATQQPSPPPSTDTSRASPPPTTPAPGRPSPRETAPQPAEPARPSASPSSAPTMNAAEVENFVKRWIDAWETSVQKNDISRLEKFYARSFRSGSNRNKTEWMKGRKEEAEKAKYLDVTAEDMKIDIQDGAALVKYTQSYLSDWYSDKGTKILKVEKTGGDLKITFEDFKDNTPPPQVSYAKIKETIIDWRKAWEDMAILKTPGDYPDFYHPDFHHPKGYDKKRWEQVMFGAAKNFSIIAIDIRNINTSILGDRAVSSFHQVFKSDRYADEGTKVLVFKVVNGKPLIIKELFFLDQKLEPLKVDDFWGP